ncbi:Acetyl-CoA synthetase-like protein [Mycena chlorophos]|uniref:Acetyl-CoA synthetase-like protein n=1 Tax=Mycena chlorophos TaxID=658473 RepID=A0A8H6S7M3_MYCCL|nr:Acetyl-CoA synthetase-like protein [Mycena chlorophos]
MPATFTQPPLDGSLDFSGIIDFHRLAPNLTTAYSWADDDDGSIVNVSHFEFARAAHRVAHLLRPGRRGQDGAVIGLLALTDSLLYQTLLAGCMIAGLVPFPISPRNSGPALLHLLTATETHRLLTTHASLGRLTDGLLKDVAAQGIKHGLSIEEIPTVCDVYPFLGKETPDVDAAFLAYPSSAKTDLSATALYLHSSGSTGLPKPIPLSHHTFTSFGALPGFQDLRALAPRLAAGALPAFHAFGLYTQILGPLVQGGTICLYPPLSLTEYRLPLGVTPANALEHAKRAGADGIMTVPALLGAWAGSEMDVEYLASLNIVTYSGGPLATRIGDDLVREGVKIVPIYGGTEFGAGNHVTTENCLAGEWMWMQPIENIRWEPVGDGTFECQFLTTETHKPAIQNLNDSEGYATKDLFERHPSKRSLFKIVGRLDDVIMLSNGEKVVPGPMEDIITASPLITAGGAVFFGREKNQVGILIEPMHPLPDSKSTSIAEFRNKIWDVVEEANAVAPAFGKVYKEMILVTSPGKMMVRAPKGTVVKKATLALYEEDIAELYDTIEESTSASDIAPPASFTSTDLVPWLLAHASSLSQKDIHPDEDLFEQGFDSLNATFLRHRIVGALRTADKPTIAQSVPQNIVYTHSSILALANTIEGLVSGKVLSGEDPKAAIEAMIAKYTAEFAVSGPEVKSDGLVVLLTGSTGGLGSHILDLLLRNQSIRRVYAFNRPSATPIDQRQAAAFRDRGLDVAVLASEKLLYLEGDSRRQDLGLSQAVYTELTQAITTIIHNAWALDFNKSLASFEPHIRGARNLIDVALTANAKFLFTSSISSAQSWDLKKGPFPEELQLDAGVAMGNGYGESKYVAERIIAASAVRGTSFRIGQIAGSSSNGSWATTDWVPAIVKSSITIGSFPSDSAASVSWILPETVAQSIVDVALLSSEVEQPFALNLVHPRPIRWDMVFGAMAREAKLPLVPLTEWIAQIGDKAKTATAADLERVPAIKLMEFLKAAAAGAGQVQFSTDEAQAVPWAPYLGTIELPPLSPSPAYPQPQLWAPIQTPIFPIDLLAPIPATSLALARLTDIIPPHARVNVKTLDTNGILFVIHTGSTVLTSGDLVLFLSWFQQTRVDPAIKPFVRCGSQLRRAMYGRDVVLGRELFRRQTMLWLMLDWQHLTGCWEIFLASGV